MKIQGNLDKQNTGNKAQIDNLWKKALLKETAEQNLVTVVREPAVSHQKGYSSMNYTGQGSGLTPLLPVESNTLQRAANNNNKKKHAANPGQRLASKSSISFTEN